MTPAAPSPQSPFDLQRAYVAHRRVWAAEVRIWLDTRELPGPPPKVETAEDLVDIVLQRDAA